MLLYMENFWCEMEQSTEGNNTENNKKNQK